MLLRLSGKIKFIYIYNLNELLLHLLKFPGRVYSMVHNRPWILIEYAEHPLLILILL